MDYIGFDPSFKGFGVACIYTGLREIHLSKLVSEIKSPDFVNIQRCIKQQVSDALKYVDEMSIIGMETPPPNSAYSAGLWGLDSALYQAVSKYNVNCYYPTFIGYLHHKRKWHKSESVSLAKQFAQVFEDLGFSIKGKFSADASEAFLFAVNLFVLCNSGLADRFLAINPRIADNKIIGGENNGKR